jgi:hypothetical protein
VHASWLNQVEVFFSIIQKKALTPNDFAGLDQLSDTLLAFTRRYNQNARPFSWKYTASDLGRYLTAIPAAPAAAARQHSLPAAA